MAAFRGLPFRLFPLSSSATNPGILSSPLSRQPSSTVTSSTPRISCLIRPFEETALCYFVAATAPSAAAYFVLCLFAVCVGTVGGELSG